MEVAQTIRSAAFLPNLDNLDQLFETPQKNTVIQLRWPLVILSCFLLLYSPGDWLYTSQIQAIVVFYLLTNVTLYFVAEDYFNQPKFYGPLLLFDTFFLALTLGLSGGTTPDLVIACLFTLILSCVCNDPRGLLLITFLAPLVYGYVVLTSTMTDDPNIYLRLPLPLVISIFYGYFAQVERQKEVAMDKEQQADRELKASEEVRRQRARLEVLYQSNPALIGDVGLGKILDVALQTTLSYLPYAAAMVTLRNHETGILQTAASKGFINRKSDAAVSSLPSLDEVINKGTTLAIKNIYEDPRVQDIGFLHDEGLVAFLGTPLRAKGAAFGSLGFFTRRQYDFTSEEREFAAALAGQLAMAIEQTRLHEKIQRQANELRDANKLKDELLGVASHQLKSPLNILARNTNMLIERTLGDISPIQEKSLEMMMRQCKELHAVITSMLQVNFIESNLIEPELHETNLWEFLFDLRLSYDSQLTKDIKLIWEFSPDLPLLEADRGKLKLVLQHVIDNAIKFTEHGYVKISAHYLANRKVMEFEVSDTGIGIPTDELPMIFEKFSRLDSSESENYSGAGLGLYIVKRIVHLLDGNIDVQSKVGKGSTVTIRIPARRRKLPPMHEQLAFAMEPEDSRSGMA
ncbi:MAG TPA: HAMP domain-containing sensor histidine kinase [Candidatus Polarisedimenticolaceae bacterium]|nr:HAMP domain-containing sensor histidine kinase [Candidatus Polarisedimenticolaceae bacterium]